MPYSLTLFCHSFLKVSILLPSTNLIVARLLDHWLLVKQYLDVNPHIVNVAVAEG